MIQGDVFVHPAQITEDGWNCHFDVDWPVSELTRRKMLERGGGKGHSDDLLPLPAARVRQK